MEDLGFASVTRGENGSSCVKFVVVSESRLWSLMELLLDSPLVALVEEEGITCKLCFLRCR